MTTPKIQNWHIVFGGFLQDEGQATNGTLGTWFNLHRSLANETTVVEWHAWNTDARNLAEKINRFSGSDMPKVYVYAYSWGATAASLLCQALQRHGIIVEIVVLTDGVYRHQYKLGWWRAAVSWSKLYFTSNVLRISYGVQKNPRFNWTRKSKGLGDFFEPSGHGIHLENDTATDVIRRPDSHLSHTHMDESVDFEIIVDTIIESIEMDKPLKWY